MYYLKYCYMLLIGDTLICTVFSVVLLENLIIYSHQAHYNRGLEYD